MDEVKLRAEIRRLLHEGRMADERPSIEVVKYRDMPSKRWYESERHRGWYYHVPRRGKSAPDVEVLESSLDPCLRELALGLNRLGYRTLPSCSGHYLRRDECDKIYDDLLRDREDIRGGGLTMVDVETGEEMIFIDQRWELPWTRRGFRGAILGTESRPEGYIAFLSPDEDSEVVRLLRGVGGRLPGVRVQLFDDDGGVRCEVRVYTGDEATQCRVWRKLGSLVAGCLQGT